MERTSSYWSCPVCRLTQVLSIWLIAAAPLCLLAAQPSTPAARPNVLLITVDTLRADALGCSGNARATAPVIARLAAAGVRFSHAWAHNVTTLASHTNILSGRLPCEHGIRDNLGFRFPTTLPTLADLLRRRGYSTGAFVSAFTLDSRYGLDKGFDVYDDRLTTHSSEDAFEVAERNGAATVAAAQHWLGQQHKSPWLCWVHLFEPHFPYSPPSQLARQYAASPYHGEVAAADAVLSPLLEPLLDEAGTHDTVVVFTSDHGESLGEHGEATHGIFAYEATLRVPLILYYPPQLKPRVVTTPARHVDLLPTILEMLDLQAPDDLTGQSLLAEARGEPASVSNRLVYFEALSGQLNRGWAPLYGVIDHRVKYIDLPVPELYDLDKDPRELTNLAATKPELVAQLQASLAPFRSADPGASPMLEGAEAREQLEALGYLSPGAPQARASYGVEDDPKQLIKLDAVLREVASLSQRGELEHAIERCQSLVEARPTMLISLLYLAQLQRQAHDLAPALVTLQRAHALDANNPVVLSLLGSTLTLTGKPQAAVSLLADQLERPDADVDVLLALGLAQARTGRLEAALTTYARARSLDPTHAKTFMGEGTTHLMAGNRVLARQAFEHALELDPGLATAHISLAMLDTEQGRVDAALEHLRAAVSLDPDELARVLALGLRLHKAGHTREARAFLELFVERASPQRWARELEQVRRLLATP